MLKNPDEYKNEDFKTYKEAGYNEPYIAAMFESPEYHNHSMFMLGWYN